MIVNFEHTNLPKEIQSQLNLQHSQLEKTQISNITIEEYRNKLMEANEIVTIHKIVSCIRIVFSDADDPRIQELVQSGLVPYFIHLAREQISPQLTAEITWILTNIASGNQAQALEIVNNGGIQLFVELLESNEKYIQVHAIWGLGNISGDSTSYRDIILSSGAIEYIIKAFKKKCCTIDVQNMVWCLSNLCKGNPLPKYEKVSMCIEIFCYAISHESNEGILTDALWALSYLNSRPCGDEEASEIIIQSKIIYRLIELLDHKSFRIQLPALKIIGNILTGDEKSIGQVLQAGFLKNIPKLLQHSKKDIRKEAGWALSNITARSQSYSSQVIKNGEILNLILKYVETEQLEVVREMAYILSNSVCNLGMEELQFLMEKGLLRSYKTILERFVDQNIIEIVIEGIIYILNKGKKLLENYYLIELKQLELDKLILENTQQFQDIDIINLYNKFVDLI